MTGTGRFALPAAAAQRRLPARYGAAEDVPVELRGAGNASRQVNNFASVEAFECDALIAVEVLTPNGNWSSYPPHRHDDLEEIYYFEISGGGFGYQRVYDGIDVLQEVRSGDRIDLPRGYHGPSMAPPGYDMYYLNVMAGTVREWNFVDDPDHAWIRRNVGGPGDRSATADDVGEETRMRLTVAQALIRFLSVQYSERDGVEQRLIAGCFGIFGHGNVAGIGQALLEQPDEMPFYHARNEQAMVHTAVGYARQKNRLSTLACTSSIGPGATNLVTGAALATINRLPVLLLPGDVFATRAPGTVLQELEDPFVLQRLRQRHAAPGLEVLGPRRAAGAARARAARRDARADRSGRDRRGHARAAAGRAGRGVRLARGAVREARVARPPSGPGAGRARGGRGADPRRLEAADRRPAAGRSTPRPPTRSPRFAEATGIPVAETQAGKGSLPYDHPQALGAIGATGTTAANAAARDADVILGVGTRWSDFTTASRSLFDGVFINLNVAAVDAFKHAALPLVADARLGLEALHGGARRDLRDAAQRLGRGRRAGVHDPPSACRRSPR